MFQFKKYKYLFFITFIVLVNYSQTGIVIGWTSPNLSKLQSPNSTIPTSSNQGYWMANVIPLSSSCATPLAAILIHYFGRKVVMTFIPVPFLLTWLMIAFSENADFIIGARVFGGLGVALLYTLTPIYLGEISPVELRSNIGILMTVFTSLGTLWVYIFGNQFNILVSSLLNLVPTLIFISLLIFLPESPYYLVKKGKNKEGFEVLCKIRQDGDCGKSPKGCQHDFSDISKNTSNIHEVGVFRKSSQGCQHESSDISKITSNTHEVGVCGKSPRCCQHESCEISKNTSNIHEVGVCGKSPQSNPHEFSDMSKNTTNIHEVGIFGKSSQSNQHEVSNISKNSTNTHEVGACRESPQSNQHEFSDMSKNTTNIHEVGVCGESPQSCQHEFSEMSKNITNINLKESFREFWVVKRHKKALFISSMAHFTSQMTGGPIIYFFSQTIFEKAGNISPNLFSIIVQISQLVSCIFSVFLVGHTGNRPLLIVSCLGSAIFMATTGLYFYFLNNSYDLTNFWWVPLFSMVAFNVFQMVGVQAIPIAFMGEFFDLKVKPFCVCLSKISMALSIFLVGIVFQLMNENFGTTVPFFIFAIFSVFGMIFFYFWVPETRGRTLQEIQFYFENGKYEK